MEFSQKQSAFTSMRQEQIMTHNQIQALELLSAPVLDLQKMVDRELEKNPILETDNDEAPATTQNDDDEQWLENVMKLDEDSRYIRSNSRYVSPDEEDRRRHYLDSIATSKTLQETLLEQLRFLDINDRIYKCCEVVISGLNDEGYLSSHPADLAMAAGESIDIVEESIGIVQQLEPAGVGARNLQDRLLIQLARKNREQSLTYTVIKDYLTDIGNNQLPAVARKMGISIKQLNDIIEEVKSLCPRLDCEGVNPNDYVSEEVTVIEQDGDFVVKVVNDYLPSLYISSHYKKLIADPKTSKEVKSYVKEKIRSGVQLINSIIQRQTTIYKTVCALVAEQNDFFRHGAKYLKPMTMATIAQHVGVHETTISRAVSGKFLRCKHGLLPLRQFFSTGYTAQNGDHVSNMVVKKSIRKLIDEENPYAPLSDSVIAVKLKKEGLKVARRTVAKYRESLGILSSNLRKKFLAVSNEN